MYARVGITMIAVGIVLFFLAGGVVYLREWKAGRRQGMPRTRRLR